MSKIKMDQEQAQELVRQIGVAALMAISGRRVWMADGTVVLPVSNGYTVEIDLDASDTYTVRRVFTRAGKRFVKGERTGVYADEVGEVAYYASSFRSYDENEWPTLLF